jgi:hypothetical protein
VNIYISATFSLSPAEDPELGLDETTRSRESFCGRAAAGTESDAPLLSFTTGAAASLESHRAPAKGPRQRFPTSKAKCTRVVALGVGSAL